MKNIYNLCDNMSLQIKCHYCLSVKQDYPDLDVFSEYLDKEGWVVNQRGRVKCPTCVKKMKRK